MNTVPALLVVGLLAVAGGPLEAQTAPTSGSGDGAVESAVAPADTVATEDTDAREASEARDDDRDASEPGASRQADERPPLVTDRPDFTESAVAVRHAQLEAGYTATVGGDTDVHQVGEVLLRLPATRGLELRVGLPSFVGDDDPLVDDGFDDALLGAKLELVGGAESPGADVALLAETLLPIGDRSAEGVETGGRLSVAVPVSSRVGVGVNLGAASVEDEVGRFAELVGSVALGLDLGSGFGAYGELFGFERTEDRPAESFADGGFTYAVGPNLQLDARVEVPLDSDRDDVSFGVGVAVRR